MNTPKHFMAFALIAVTGCISACSVDLNINEKRPRFAREIVKSTIPLEDFHALSIEGCGDIVYRQTDEKRDAVLEVPKGLEDDIVVEVDKGMLKLKQKQGVSFSLTNGEYIRLTAYSPMVSHVAITGSGDVDLGTVSTSAMNIHLMGSGDVKALRLNVDYEMGISLNGSGDVEMGRLLVKEGSPQMSVTGSGNITVKELLVKGAGSQFNLVGSGDINIGRFDIEKGVGTANLTGSGDISISKITADKMVANVLGSGDIELKGGPVSEATLNLSGSGSLNAMKMPSDFVKAMVTGTGKISCWADKRINAHVEDNGEITYVGDGELISTTPDKVEHQKKH